MMRITNPGLDADLHNFWLKSVSHELIEKPVTVFGIVMIGISLEGEVTLN